MLTYVLQLLAQEGHGTRLAFKGGTALRKLVFGPTGRFSVDLDFVALDDAQPGPDEDLVRDFSNVTFYDIELRMVDFAYTGPNTFRASLSYEHRDGRQEIRVEISQRQDIVITPKARALLREVYFPRLEFAPLDVVSLHPQEMLAEKILACNRRGRGGSARDIYDLYQFARLGFDNRVVTSLTCLKAWTDGVVFSPTEFLRSVEPSNYDWTALKGLVGSQRETDRSGICARVLDRYSVLADISELDKCVLDDAALHRNRQCYEDLAEAVRAEVRRRGL